MRLHTSSDKDPPHRPGHHHGLGRRAGPSLAEAKAFSFPLLPPLPVRFTNSSPGFRGFLPPGWLHRPQVPAGLGDGFLSLFPFLHNKALLSRPHRVFGVRTLLKI